VTAIILWNTRYLERAVATLRQTEDVSDYLLAHLSPLGWEHVNLTGDYIWAAEQVSENIYGLRSPSPAPEPFLKVARCSGLARLCVLEGQFVSSGLDARLGPDRRFGGRHRPRP